MTRVPRPTPAVLVHPSSILWCRRHSGETYDFDAFQEAVRRFHGYAAPGLLLGGKMVHLALESLPPGILFDALCETAHCLPDAVQMLTPCTTGNGWLRVEDLGRFALALYDKATGRGVRVCLDASRLEAWPEIGAWFFKRKPKAEQDPERLVEEIRRAGEAVLRRQAVHLRPECLVKRSVGPRALCGGCGESYPARHGALCRACQGQSPYLEGGAAAVAGRGPAAVSALRAAAPGRRPNG